MQYIAKIATAAGLLFMGLAVALLAQIDVAALRAADALYPGSGVWVCLGLVLAELAALLWLYLALFARPAKLVLRRDASAEEQQAFLAEMRRRLARNSHVRDAGLSRDAPDFMEQALAVLDARAEAEIRSSGKKVFLGTALAQNGRLDALIVFFALCRMVWRISAVYNQRPTPREILSVYSTVSSATFVAFSIDALNIPQTIADAMNELVPSVAPAMAASSVPFVGAAMHVFTASVIDGAANSLLAVRAGVITRRAYRYAMYGGEENLRSSTVRETGGILLDISQESVGAIVKALKKELQALSLNSGRKFMDNAGRMTAGVTSAVADAAADAADLVSDSAQTVADCGRATVEAVMDGAQKMAETVRHSADALGTTARAAGSSVVEGAQTVGSAVRSGGRAVADTAVSGVQKAADGVRTTADFLGETARTVGGALGTAGRETLSQVRKTGEALRDLLPGRGKKS